MYRQALLSFGLLLLLTPMPGIAQTYSFIIHDVSALVGFPPSFEVQESPEMSRAAKKNMIGSSFSIEVIGSSYARVNMPWIEGESGILLEKDESTGGYSGERGDGLGVNSLDFNKTFGRITGGFYSSVLPLTQDDGGRILVQIIYVFERR